MVLLSSMVDDPRAPVMNNFPNHVCINSIVPLLGHSSHLMPESTFAYFVLSILSPRSSLVLRNKLMHPS
ncbi:778_t:CDS:2 [Funneliformis caledonium]|uniref:778_t:CDS:1 n=1 Tax=Funneliformis caledonium TaxID=1117310 RepID=A0A9N8YZ23_9GLOM|nr:778_t:CDS:2 [Funneliformis caledonium]